MNKKDVINRKPGKVIRYLFKIGPGYEDITASDQNCMEVEE